MTIELSKKAISDLRVELKKSYGDDFCLTDNELNEIGTLLLAILAESLKMKKML
ncbi:MAG TPA: hypothetical protein VGO63_02110 [Candidatus Paceibacterota bacterium]|jgi:hypothetical protein|nr:hypothetical protein [Candidatus Paceibacterota bacterium]